MEGGGVNCEVVEVVDFVMIVGGVVVGVGVVFVVVVRVVGLFWFGFWKLMMIFLIFVGVVFFFGVEVVIWLFKKWLSWFLEGFLGENFGEL